MAEHKEKKEKEESFISLGSEPKSEPGPESEKKEGHHHKASHKEHTTAPSQAEKEYVLDFSIFHGIFQKIDRRVLAYAILAIVLFISAYLRYLPINTYPAEAPLGGADNWWQYRHSKEIYEHGYPGTDVVDASTHGGCPYNIVCLFTGGKTYWDSLHNAPDGALAPLEFYHYFVAYSYKYFFKLFFPSLIKYLQFVPLMFGVLATLSMFLLVRENLGVRAGLVAAFIFGISPHFLQRSVIGQADTDAIIIFFTIFTTFLFLRALNKKSLKWAAIAGISLGLFGFTWPGGYTFIPMLIIAAAVIYYSFKLLSSAILENGPLSELKNYYIILIAVLLFSVLFVFAKGLSIVLLFALGGFLFTVAMPVPLLALLLKNRDALKRLIKDEWRSFAVIAIFLVIGLVMVAIIYNTAYADLFKSIKGFSTLRAIQRHPGTGGTVIRNVFLTVAEFNPASTRMIIYTTHIAPFILALSSLVLVPFGLLKKIRSNIFFFSMVLLFAAATFYSALQGNRFIENFAIPMAILASIVAGAPAYYDAPDKEKLKKILALGPILLLVVVLLVVPNISAVKGQSQFGPAYVQTSFSIAKSAGGGEGSNWLEFFKWARENTPARTIFASWWDPGHSFTALAERPTVADGSQSHVHVHDLAIMFTTTNITQAVELIKQYNISYFYTSSDLISKYGAISFLASGNGENYQMLSADKNQVTQTAGGNLMVPYPFDIQTSQGTLKTTVLVSIKNNGTDISANWAIGNNPPQKIARLFFYDQNNAGYLKKEPGNDTADMLLYIFPGYGNAIFLPPHLENNTLTRLHLFEGKDVSQYFTKVKDFGGEIKVYKINYT